MTWVFILSLVAATFGGDFTVTFTTHDEISCQKLRKVVLREMDKMVMRYEATPCEEAVSA